MTSGPLCGKLIKICHAEVMTVTVVFQAVRHRVQIGHGTHRGVSAVSGGLGAAGHGLLIRKARLTKMYVYINETGTYHKRRMRRK